MSVSGSAAALMAPFTGRAGVRGRPWNCERVQAVPPMSAVRRLACSGSSLSPHDSSSRPVSVDDETGPVDNGRRSTNVMSSSRP